MFAGVVGLGAFLLFQVQLILGKHLLPGYGGTSAVWTTCLLFFQATLLAGYAWAHLLAGRLPPRRQRDAHLVLLGLAMALLAGRGIAWSSPITPADAVPWSATDAPIRSILGELASTIGLPFVVLAATSPLLQAWFARLRPGASPFRLFALSNAGSLVGLVSYPLLVEPLASIREQGWLWSSAFAVYAAGVAWCAIVAGPSSRGAPAVHSDPSSRGASAEHSGPSSRGAPAEHSGPSSRGAQLESGDEGSAGVADPSSPGKSGLVGTTRLWLALAFFPSAMLAAVTSHLTHEVAAVPFLWMLPLALYLLSFIVPFARPDADRTAWRLALVAAAGLAVLGLHGGLLLRVPARVALWSAILFVYGMAGHGELARRRPSPERLTGYYLTIAAGGALGGVLNAIVAPLAFSGYWELHIGILAGPLTVVGAWLGDHGRGGGGEPSSEVRQRQVVALVGLAVLAGALAADVVGQSRGVLRASRGFYGVLRVAREEPGQPDEYVKLLHGRITHGIQLTSPARRAELTTYFGPSSGVGMAIRRHPKRLAGRTMRIGVIGLGVGTIAAWSRPGDVVRFYELDPEVERLSRDERPAFTYLDDALGEVSVALGDGRRLLAREAPQEYDVLVVDAFSSDAIPTHLLTREAFRVYLRHLADGGVLVVQITNRYVDLKPVVRGVATALGLQAEHVPSFENDVRWSSDWMLVARNRALLEDDVVSAATLPPRPGDGEVVWTDDWSNLLRVLKR